MDFYLKGSVAFTTTVSTTTITTSTATVHPKVDSMLEMIEALEAAIVNGDGTVAEFAAVKATLKSADDKIQEQGKTIYTLTSRLNEEVVERKLLAEQVKDYPKQMDAMQAAMSEMQTRAQFNQDYILERLNQAAVLANTTKLDKQRALNSACSGNKCAAPQISSDNQDMLIEAPNGNIGFFTEKCTDGIDLCELATLANQLKAALANFMMGTD